MNFEETLKFIKKAHAGQMYGDLPYWMHPAEVSRRVDSSSEDERIAALLHDVVDTAISLKTLLMANTMIFQNTQGQQNETFEDTDYTIEDLRELGYNEEILDIVNLLSKLGGMSYHDAIQRIIDSGNVSAMKVKLADNIANISGDKSHMSNERKVRLFQKYSWSISVLSTAIYGG